MPEATCFVIMPYGVKPDIDGNEVDFDEIYEQLIRKAVEADPPDGAGLECLRCDDIEQPGWIHDRMVRHIASDAVAIVDTSTLNANVFYELGVRHALRRSTTVLIHKKGTSWPFNIAGLSSIEYELTEEGMADARQKIARFITNGMADPEAIDSLVYYVLDDLVVARGAPRGELPVLETVVLEYPLRVRPEKAVGIVAGDLQSIDVGDVWVNSENTNMQMDRYFGKSTSATIRYLGTEKHPVSNRVLSDPIADDLARLMEGEHEVEPATVIATTSGALEATNGVKRIFHVASVTPQAREGYVPIERIDRCVTNALAHAERPELRDAELRTILFPVFGTGAGGRGFREQCEIFFDAAVSYLQTQESSMERVYFYAWSDLRLDIARELMEADERLAAG